MSNLLQKIAPYSKAAVALLGAFVIAAESVADGAISQGEGLAIATALVAAYGVYKKRNAPMPPPAA